MRPTVVAQVTRVGQPQLVYRFLPPIGTSWQPDRVARRPAAIVETLRPIVLPIVSDNPPVVIPVQALRIVTSHPQPQALRAATGHPVDAIVINIHNIHWAGGELSDVELLAIASLHWAAVHGAPAPELRLVRAELRLVRVAVLSASEEQDPIAEVMVVERCFSMEADGCLESSFEEYEMNTCCICYSENNTWDLWKQCGHMFCSQCSTEVMQRRQRCPLCRVHSTLVVRASAQIGKPKRNASKSVWPGRWKCVC